MRDNGAPTGRRKMVLTMILIAANLLMLVVAIITIPPNLRGTAEKADIPFAVKSASPIVTQEQSKAGIDASTPSDTPDPKEEIPAPEVPSVDVSTGERPNLVDFLWYTEDVFYNDVPADAAIIDNVKYTILSGENKMSGLMKLLSTGGYVEVDRWHNWITSCIGNPSKYAVDFFTKVVLCDDSVWGDKGGFPPYQLHSAITALKKELGT